MNLIFTVLFLNFISLSANADMTLDNLIFDNIRNKLIKNDPSIITGTNK